MTFLHPAALVGLVAAATPVAIYLLLRRRKKEVQWGAGYLLRLALASRKKSSLWRQMVVLAVRSLILALVGLLITQPFRPGTNPSTDTPALPDRAVHRVVLFDNSRSMTVTEDNLTRLDRARMAAGALLRSQRSGDTLDLIPLIPEATDALQPVTLDGKVDSDRIEHALAAIPVRDGLLALEPALAAAMRRLAATPGSAGEIYLLSDFPRELESQIESVAWFAPLAKERGIRLAPVNMVGQGSDAAQQNVSIDALTLGTDLLVAGVPTRLYVDAVNHSGRETIATFDVSLKGPIEQMVDVEQSSPQIKVVGRKRVAVQLDPPGAGGKPVALDTDSHHRVAVRLNPEEHKRVAIPITPYLVEVTAGDASGRKPTAVPLAFTGGESVVVNGALTVAVQPSRLASLGTRSLSIGVKNALDVWLVTDEKDRAAAGSGEPDDADFLKRALKPRKGGFTGVRLREARMNELTLPIPANVDAIILAGLGAYTTPAIAGPLTDFVRRGGGLLITASPEIQLPAFNENLGALLPAPLDKPMRAKIEPESFVQAQVETTGADVERPLFEEFSAASAITSDLGQARYYNHYLLTDSQAIPGVLLRLSSGDPLLVEKQIGRGRVLFYGSTLGVGWTSLPVRQCYIPLITRMLNEAIEGRTLPLNLAPGATFIARWPAGGALTLTLPDQGTRNVSVCSTAAAGEFVVLDGLRDPGTYQLADAAGNRSAFTITGGAAESDLRSLPESARIRLGVA